jgi:hypothetical protein
MGNAYGDMIIGVFYDNDVASLKFKDGTSWAFRPSDIREVITDRNVIKIYLSDFGFNPIVRHAASEEIAQSIAIDIMRVRVNGQ